MHPRRIVDTIQTMDSLQGQILIASPKLRDPNFAESVVLLVQHDDNGALGLILNRPLEMRIDQAWDQVSEVPCNSEQHLHLGGPCEGPLMALHDQASLGQLIVLPGVHFSTEKFALEQLVGEDYRPSKFFVGYSGWSPGQLEREIADGAWLQAQANDDFIFSAEEDLWLNLHRQISFRQQHPWVDPNLIPPDPSVN